MSGPGDRRLARTIAGGAALLAVGIAAGVAAEQSLVGRRLRADSEADEPFGSLRGTEVEVVCPDGATLHVEVEEPAPSVRDDLTLVFCHGYALNQDSWHYQRRDLRSLARLVFVDQRSHGRSVRAAPIEALSQLGDDLARVLEVVVPDAPVILVGHSMGGMTIMELAASHPSLFGSKVAGVALMATTAGGMSRANLGLPPALAGLVHRLAPGVLLRAAQQRELVEATRMRANDLSLIITRWYSFGSQVPVSLTRFTADMINQTPVDVVAEFLPPVLAHERAEALAALAGVETLVLVGDRDMLTPPSHAHEIVRRVPHAELVIVPSAGHMVMLERYPEVNYHLRELAARVRRTL